MEVWEEEATEMHSITKEKFQMVTQSHSIAGPSIQEIEGHIAGEIIRPGDEAYDVARRVWNGMIDRYPALIIRCTNEDDVIAAVNFSRGAGLAVAVRGGGHNVAGHGTCDNGIVIDLSPMKDVQVDPAARTARVQGGARWGDVDRATQVYGLAAPGGEVSETGIAGLTLGGGMGFLRRKYGLSCDNLLGVDIVTADGKLLRADEHQNQDLFWGVRGGGGNFGVVTAFEYQLHPVGPEVSVSSVIYPWEDAVQVLRHWREYTKAAPDEVSSSCILLSVPAIPDFPEELHNRPVVMTDAMYSGTGPEAEEALRPLGEFAQPLVDLSGSAFYLDVQSAFDPLVPAGDRYYWKSHNSLELSDALIERTIKYGESRPSPRTGIVIRHLGGAISRVAADATAFGDRSALYNLSIDAIWSNPEDDQPNITWSRATWEDLREFSRGVYLNFPGFQEETDQLVQAQYGQNYQRLQSLKRRYDPTNLFRLNQNIKPGV